MVIAFLIDIFLNCFNLVFLVLVYQNDTLIVIMKEQILHANTPREAKSAAAVITNLDLSSLWNLVKYDVMRQVPRAKAESSEVFRQHLLET